MPEPLLPFPHASLVRWRRLDAPGCEVARVTRTMDGWRLVGDLDVREAGIEASLRYDIACDGAWRTRHALVEGDVDRQPFRIELAADGEGHWTRDGDRRVELDGALDVDLGFTPATNMLPIRRLDLAIGECASVLTAWLRFPELRVERLEQTYSRESAQAFRYRALVDGDEFVARLDTDRFGRVLRYEGLWTAESLEPPG